MGKLEKLYDTLERNGIVVFECHFKKRVAVSDPDDYIGIDYSKVDSRAEEIYILGHEGGHCATGSFYNINSPADIKGRHEERADRWAIKMLIPKDELDEAVQNGITTPWDLAEYFDVTEPFLRKAVEYYKVAQ